MLALNRFHTFSADSIVDFEQVKVGYVLYDLSSNYTLPLHQQKMMSRPVNERRAIAPTRASIYLGVLSSHVHNFI